MTNGAEVTDGAEVTSGVVVIDGVVVTDGTEAMATATVMVTVMDGEMVAEAAGLLDISMFHPMQDGARAATKTTLFSVLTWVLTAMPTVPSLIHASAIRTESALLRQTQTLATNAIHTLTSLALDKATHVATAKLLQINSFD